MVNELSILNKYLGESSLRDTTRIMFFQRNVWKYTMDILEKISELYGKIYKYNSLLLKKSEDLSLENKYDFDDIFDFRFYGSGS